LPRYRCCAPRTAALIGLVLLSVSGCVGTTGHLAVASTRDVDLQHMAAAAPQHVIGRSCITVIGVVPLAMPNIGNAIDDALQQTGGRMLTNVSIRYEIRDLPFIYGIACYVAEGDAQ